MGGYPFVVHEMSIDDDTESSMFSDLCEFCIHSKCSYLNFLDMNHANVLNVSVIYFLLVHLTTKISTYLFLTTTRITQILVAP